MTKKKANFQELYKRLEEISQILDSSEIDVDQGLKLVEESKTIHKKLTAILNSAKLKISKAK